MWIRALNRLSRDRPVCESRHLKAFELYHSRNQSGRPPLEESAGKRYFSALFSSPSTHQECVKPLREEISAPLAATKAAI